MVVLTKKGKRTLADPVIAADLISLPQRHRIYRAALRDSDHPDHVRAMFDKWRREMDRSVAEHSRWAIRVAGASPTRWSRSTLKIAPAEAGRKHRAGQ